jgi:hypothetical protein
VHHVMERSVGAEDLRAVEPICREHAPRTSSERISQPEAPRKLSSTASDVGNRSVQSAVAVSS